MTNARLELFKKYVVEIGYSKGSCYQIPYCVGEFLAFTAKDLSAIDREDIGVFYEHLQTRPLKYRKGVLSPSMITHYVLSLRIFFAWLEQTGTITQNPMSTMTFKKLARVSREPLSKADMLLLFSCAVTARDRAILHLFYSCGLRRSEAERLNTSDIHFGKNMLYVRLGKGSKRRAIPINEKVKQDFMLYYDHERGTSSEPAFILNDRNSRMRGETYNKLLSRLVKASKLDKKVSLHHLRHSIATHLLENGLKVEFVRDFLGHRHLESTQIYTKVKFEQVKHL